VTKQWEFVRSHLKGLLDAAIQSIVDEIAPQGWAVPTRKKENRGFCGLTRIKKVKNFVTENTEKVKFERNLMTKTIITCMCMSITGVFFSIDKEATFISAAEKHANEEAIELKNLDLDGFRYINKLHKDIDVHVFWNNGVYGKGLMLSFFGELNSRVLNVKNIRSEKVILEDGTQLMHEQIREHRDSIILGNDNRSLGFQIDLDIPRIANIKHISGKFDIVRAKGGSFEVVSDLLKDESGSKDNKIGIDINIASNWMGGRYYVLIIEDAETILELTVLDKNGNKFKQTDPFRVYGVKNDRVKVYVDKKKGVPFAIKLKRAKKLHVQSIPFVLENINLMTY
jgi:hypothetical protein